jgi:hypothetical protein
MSEHDCKQLFLLFITRYLDYLHAITQVAIYPTANIDFEFSHSLVTTGALVCDVVCRVGVVKLLFSIVN